MAFTFITRSLKQILPRTEIRARDRRSGAYPVISKTGDRTRTGRNKYYFDDQRTVLFVTGVNITYPTTLQFDSNKVATNLTATFGSQQTQITGNVNPYAVDQFIPHREQNEIPGPFFDNDLFEQDETNLVNSKFMTGVAHLIAPDRFKSKLSNKTIIRAEYPLRSVSQIPSGSALMYFNPTSGSFVLKKEEYSYTRCLNGIGLMTFAPLPFTPYGMSYMPINNYDLKLSGTAGSIAAENAVKRMSTYNGDGSDSTFFVGGSSVTGFTTSSLLNPAHVASDQQIVSLSNMIDHPFLLEKIAVEFPFQAGPDWLNDSFQLGESLISGTQFSSDAGGPLITFAVMRQDGSDEKNRDLIASGTITNKLDMTTGYYSQCTGTTGGGITEQVTHPNGVAQLGIVPNVVITGSILSGANNYFTGTIKMILEPQITSHMLRARTSGSTVFLNSTINSTNTAFGVVFGSIARRSSKNIESSRNMLGNSFAILDPTKLNQANNPINVMDNQFENLPQDSSPLVKRSKYYIDVKSKTTKSPYLLLPQDKLIFCLSKHRAVANSSSIANDVLDTATPSPLTNFLSYHDVAIGTGLFKVTLYGDLIRNDTEFHDTLNQRLETEEIWQDVGENPVLDQFDVSLRTEFSGSYFDRFNVLNSLSSYGNHELSSSIITSQYYSKFSSKDNNSERLSPEYSWSNQYEIRTLKKSNHNINHASENETFWDSRIPDPVECIKICNPNYRLYSAAGATTQISFAMYTGNGMFAQTTDTVELGYGINDWMMTYPYEPRYHDVSAKFSNLIIQDLMTLKNYSSNDTSRGILKYRAISIELGHSGSSGVFRRLGTEPHDNKTVNRRGLMMPEFIKAFYGIGDGTSNIDNQHVKFRTGEYTDRSQGVIMRGWRYGMMSGFPLKSNVVFRRDHFGHPRDLLEQRLDAKFYDEIGMSSDGSVNGVIGPKAAPVQVSFYDHTGSLTDPLKTLSSNVSNEATSSIPYADGNFTNRPAYDFSTMNISQLT